MRANSVVTQMPITKPSRFLQTVIVILLLTLVSACYQVAPTPNAPTLTPVHVPAPRPAQTVVIDGSAIVARLMQSESVGFQAFVPNYTAQVNSSGTRDGFQHFCQDETDIQDALRVMAPDEAAECLRNGINYLQVTIGYDALAIIGDAPIGDCISASELTYIYTHKNLLWSDMRVGLPALPISVFAPPPETAEAQFFSEQVITTQRPVQAGDIQVLISSGGGLGYISLPAARKLGSRIKLFAVDSGSGCTAPIEASIWDGSYNFLSRPLYIYINRDSVHRSEVYRFLTFVFSNLGQQRINEAEFIVAPPTTYTDAQGQIDGAYRQTP
jgi:phosphate transport system substrate-binding protein